MTKIRTPHIPDFATARAMLREIDQTMHACYALPDAATACAELPRFLDELSDTCTSAPDIAFVHAARGYLDAYSNPNVELGVPHELKGILGTQTFEARPSYVEWFDAETLYVRMDTLEDFEVPSHASVLIFDLRSCVYGDDDAIHGLAQYMTSTPCELTDLVDTTWVANVCDTNIDRMCAALTALQSAGGSVAQGAAELIEELNSRRGKERLTQDFSSDYAGRRIEPRGYARVGVIVGPSTCGAAERLAAACALLARSVVVGAPTSGAFHTSEPCILNLGGGYSLSYPTSARAIDIENHLITCTGVQPEIRVSYANEKYAAVDNPKHDPAVGAALAAARGL